MTEINNVYGHPMVYPNSENILPPLEKERVRVVEAATRAEIASHRVKEIEERIEEIRQPTDHHDSEQGIETCAHDILFGDGFL